MKTRTPGRSAALPLIGAAMTMRMYWGLSLDFHYALNAIWLCPVLGLIIYLPFAFALRQAAGLGNSSPWENLSRRAPGGVMNAAAAGFALLLIYDAAATVQLMALSSNVLALNDVSPMLLILPLALVILCVVKLGMDALGNSARLWLRVLPVFVIVILIVQSKSYRFGWLTPVLGGGMPGIVSGGVYCAGCMALLTLAWLLALPDRRAGGLLPCAALSAAATALLMLSQQLLNPPMMGTVLNTAARIDLILNNGRMTLSPQIIVDVLWFGNMLYLISAEAVAAAEYVRMIAPKIPVWPLAAGVALVIGASAAQNGAWLRANPTVVCNLFAVIGAAFALLLLIAIFRRRGGTA